MTSLCFLVDSFPDNCELTLLLNIILGVIESVGPDVTKFKPGDSVFTVRSVTGRCSWDWRLYHFCFYGSCTLWAVTRPTSETARRLISSQHTTMIVHSCNFLIYFKIGIRCSKDMFLLNCASWSVCGFSRKPSYLTLLMLSWYAGKYDVDISCNAI